MNTPANATRLAAQGPRDYMALVCQGDDVK